MQNTSVDNNGQCEINCYVEKLCFSFNLGMPESGDKLICELSDSDHYQHPGDLVSKKGFSYHPTAVSVITVDCSLTKKSTGNMELLWFSFAMLYDCLKNSRQQPIRCNIQNQIQSWLGRTRFPALAWRRLRVLASSCVTFVANIMGHCDCLVFIFLYIFFYQNGSTQ